MCTPVTGGKLRIGNEPVPTGPSETLPATIHRKHHYRTPASPIAALTIPPPVSLHGVKRRPRLRPIPVDQPAEATNEIVDGNSSGIDGLRRTGQSASAILPYTAQLPPVTGGVIIYIYDIHTHHGRPHHL